MSVRVFAETAEGSGTAFDAEVQVTATATLTAEADVVPGAKPRLSLLGLPVTHEIVVRYSDLQDDPDGPCVIEVLAFSGEVIVSGVGDTAGDALAQVFEHMLPPDNAEYVQVEDPDPDDND